MTPMLDQIAEGLKQAGVLRVMRLFPEIFAPLLIYSGVVSSEDVLQALDIDADSTICGTVTLQFLQEFIEQANETSKFKE